ncbi:hypothetical protein EL22_25270 [Halostagnicola sp. A56]|nr:hypothetical protein EL22_25270 [Halostagnicola sp. A56]
MIIGVAILAIVIDAVVYPIYEFGGESGFRDGPFSSIHELVGSLMWWIVPIFLVGILIWVLVGPIQRTRREQEQRRIR